MRIICLAIWLMYCTGLVHGQDILVLSDTVSCHAIPGKTDMEGNFFSFKDLSEVSDTSDTSYYYKYDQDSVLIWRRVLGPDSTLHKDYSTHKSTGSVVCYTDSIEKKIYLASYSKSGDPIWVIQSETIENGKVFDLKIHSGSQGDIYLAISQSGDLSIDTLNITKPDTLDGHRHILISFSENGKAKWYRTTSTLNKDSLTPKELKLFTDENDLVYLSGAFKENFLLTDIKVINQGASSNHYLSSFNQQGSMEYLTKTGNGGNVVDDASFSEVCKIEGSDVYFSYQFNIEGHDSSYSVLGKDKVYKGNHTVKISPPTESAEIIHRLNCGGAIIDAPGKIWLEDRQLSPSQYLDLESSNHTTGTIDQWNWTNHTSAPNHVFGNNRYDRPFGGDLKYHFPLDPGTYYINLYFAEKPNLPGVGNEGERVFDVLLNNEVVIEDLDIIKEAGFYALQKPILFSNLSDSLTISFNRKVYDPQINGIEIIANYPTNLKNFPLSVSKKDNKTRSSIVVSNPFSDQIRVFAQDDLRNTNITLLSIDGKILFQRESQILSGQVLLIPANPDWSSGLYIIRINERAIPIFKTH